MKTQEENTKEQHEAPVQRVDQEPGTGGTAVIEDNRPSTVYQRKLRETMDAAAARKALPVQRKANTTGLPDHLKAGVENLSGYSMDDVKVHYNSSKPAQLQAHAYAQGTDIHIAPGQEKHLPHEAWHVVQQKQGRVAPTMQLKGQVNINDDAGLEKEADVMGGRGDYYQSTIPERVQDHTRVMMRGVVQRTGKPEDQARGAQSAGTCGIYTIAHAISHLYKLNTKNDFDEVKDALLRAAGQVDARITAEGEILTFDAARTIVDKYNESAERKIHLARNVAITEDETTAAKWKEKTQTDTNNPEDDSIIMAVDAQVLDIFKKKQEVETDLKDIQGSVNSAGAHWVMITNIDTTGIEVLDPNDEAGVIKIPMEYAHLLTTKLTAPTEGTYLHQVYNPQREDGTEKTWVEGMTPEGRDRDWTAMFPAGADLASQRAIVEERLRAKRNSTTQLDLRGLTIRITKRS